MKNLHKLFMSALPAVGVLSLALASCSGKHDQRETYSQLTTIDVAYPVVDSVVVHTTFPGYLSADKSIDIVARVNGYLQAKYFEDGEYVSKGQVLFKIEDSQYRDQVQQAEAQLNTAIATNAYNTKHYEAMKKAIQSDAVSQMDVIQAESAMNQSKASIESARAALQTARTTLGYCTVVSPIDGHIAAPTVTVGDYVPGGASPFKLTTVYDDKTVNAVFSVDDAQYLDILKNLESIPQLYKSVPVQFGDTVNITRDGTLTYIAPNIVTTTGSIDMKVKLENGDGALKSGMYALVNMPMGANDKAVLVKDASVGTDQRGKYLYTLNDSNKVVYTTIEVGEVVNDSMVIVLSGIEPDTRYVTRALLKVRSGMEVKPNVVK